jgi:UrcA family protein
MLKTLSALAALAVASALLVPTVSQAQETSSVRISYADLNLATDFGQHKLQRRISFAAVNVCDVADPHDFNFMQYVKACRAGAIAGAQPGFAAAVAAAQRRGTVTVLDSAALIVARP